MNPYKRWTGKQRLASLKLTKKAISDGVIPAPQQCSQCGKTTGRIDYHNTDYSDPIKYLIALCQGCHTKLHREENKVATAIQERICALVDEIVLTKRRDPVANIEPLEQELLTSVYRLYGVSEVEIGS